jgi:hypothetical protein
MNQLLAEQVAKGKSVWPDDIYKKFTTPPAPLDANHLYMGTDWSLTDNCSAFTDNTFFWTLQRVLKDPKSSEGAKKQAQELLDLSIPGLKAPGPIDDECQIFVARLPGLVSKKITPSNANNNGQTSKAA